MAISAFAEEFLQVKGRRLLSKRWFEATRNRYWVGKCFRWSVLQRNGADAPGGWAERKGADFGGQGQNRTADTRIFSPLLYRLSYLAEARYLTCSRKLRSR